MAELQERMTSKEFVEWMAYERIDPFGSTREDIRSAIIAMTIHNKDRRRGQTPAKISDFIPTFSRPGIQQVPEMQTEILEFARTHGIAVEDRR